MTASKTANTGFNVQFCILSALGMFFVVDGHLNNSYLDIGGLIPYYAFHMPLFIFISGYFYKKQSEQDIPGYVRKKIVRLLVPYLIFNLIYGLIAQIFHRAGFAFGEDLTLWNLLVEPFIAGHQFTYNLASWFVPALFVVEVGNVLLRRLFRFLRLEQEYLITLIYLALGITAVYFSLREIPQGWALTLTRFLFLLPCYQLGTLYKEKLEEKDTLGSGTYFLLILAVQFLLVMSKKPLIYSVAFCNSFSGLILPYITAVTGIAFWLRVSRILVPALKDSRAVLYYGKNTYAVMMHHLMAFMVIKTGFAAMAKYTHLFVGFSFESYKTDFWYFYFPGGLPQFRVIYLLGGIIMPLLVQMGIDAVKGRRRRRSGVSAKSGCKPA